MNEQVKLAKSEVQPIRKYRTVFTSTKGLLRKKRWVMLDIDEYGLTYRSEPNFAGTVVSSMYLAMKEIIIDQRAFTVTVKNAERDVHRIWVIDLKRLDGDLWANFNIIKEKISMFAENKLVIKN